MVWLKGGLAGIGLFLGLVILISCLAGNGAADAIASILIGASMATPSAWWFYCQAQDKKRRKHHADMVRSNYELAAMLQTNYSQVTAGMQPPEEPTLFDRRWLIVTPVSIALAVVGCAVVMSIT